jgi:iron complex transport system ATP-binding protein
MSINVENLYLGYGKKNVVSNISFNVNDGEIVCIIGPNGSGKSTILKALTRCIKPLSGKVLLDGEDISKIPPKDAAKKIAILPQVKISPSDIGVEELVSYGRYPHLKFGGALKSSDKEIIAWSLKKTGLLEMKDRIVETLSGGERQRVWIAMTLCQKPSILIMDEPTTYLDIQYQIETLELIRELNQKLKITIIMVLHDLNQAARYADRILVVNKGMVWAYGKSKDILNNNLLKDVFNINADVYEDKVNKCPYFIPRAQVNDL